jgi:polysaccharide biosynthesis/export protein
MKNTILTTFALAIALTGSALAQTATFTDRDPHYKLQAEDKIEIQYRYTPEYNSTVAVQPDGYVSLPLLGEVKLENLSLAEAKNAITVKARERLADPEVTVLLKEYVKPYFVVAGEVAHPGRFDFHGDTTLVEALAISGGLKDSSKRTQVVLLHKIGPDLAEVHLLDVRKLMTGTNIREDVPVRPGDMIVVPRNFISRIEPYVRLAETGLYSIVLGLK